ncbi:unnamed protein product, partial [Larinioides sclopetarius]
AQAAEKFRNCQSPRVGILFWRFLKTFLDSEPFSHFSRSNL